MLCRSTARFMAHCNVSTSPGVYVIDVDGFFGEQCCHHSSRSVSSAKPGLSSILGGPCGGS
jgi:hypothetical protein